MQNCGKCGPEKDCSECIHDKPIILFGLRGALVDELLNHYFLGRVNPTPEDEEEDDELREWLIRASGWETKTIHQLQEELRKFTNSPGH